MSPLAREIFKAVACGAAFGLGFVAFLGLYVMFMQWMEAPL